MSSEEDTERSALRKVTIAVPYLPPLEEFIPFLEDIWQRKWLTNAGPYHERLEAALSEYLGVPHVSLFNNGEIALVVALRALELSGDVITTPFSFVGTSSALLWSGLRPVFADIDPVTLNLDPAATLSCLSPEVAAILPVHCYGRPADVHAFDALGKRHQIPIIYDGAHAFGVSVHGQSVFSFGDASIVSFHATKLFNTFEGGAVVSSTAEMKASVDRMRNFGIDDEVSASSVGINGKMSEISAAFGLLQLTHLSRNLSAREVIARIYDQELGLVAGIRSIGAIQGNYSYYAIMVEPHYPLSRDQLYESMKSVGILSRRYFFPLIADLKPYRGLPGASELPVARGAAGKILCLPIHANMTAADARYVSDHISSRGRNGSYRNNTNVSSL
ncbi:MAG: DegT/DnrJ/EryC1/StrS family aminotransferase [Devosia sp.]